MKKKTFGRALVEEMAAEQRRVVGDWRALLLLRRATRRVPLEERRWSKAPSNVEEVRAILGRLVLNGEFQHPEELPFLYEVCAPYARTGVISEDELLMEVHPYAALSHITALVFHGMTDDFPQELHVILPTEGKGDLLPPGTRIEDWDGPWHAQHAHGRTVDTLFGKPVRWHRLPRGSSVFGTEEYRPRGYPVRVTTPERTLLDGLLHPEWCGGFEKVLLAWLRMRDTLDLEQVVKLVEQFNVAVLRQRVGFILEELGLEHPQVANWPEQAKRGGSSRLVGSAPFATKFSERWKLSINAPIDILHEA
jgi:predicted transcriptional regulator of viral defense system